MMFLYAWFFRQNSIVSKYIFAANFFYATSVFFVFLFSHGFVYTSAQHRSACIIIHGTWAKDEKWYRPGGDFFEAIRSTNEELQEVDEVVSFSWSGKLGYPAQVEAAERLVNIIDRYAFVIVVGHSHGATVGMIAAEIVGEKNSDGNKNGKIRKFYALGVPVSERVITPNHFIIKKFYNLFSFGDFVQVVNGLCNRTFSVQKNIANISVQCNLQHPTHTELHHPSIGVHLLKIDEFFAERSIGNFQNLSFFSPGMIHFKDYYHPVYSIQENQYDLLELDKKLYEWATIAFFRRSQAD